MFERLFQWTCRNGSRILFAMALIIFVVQLTAVIVVYVAKNRGDMVVPSFDHQNWRYLFVALGAALQSAALPLAAALIVEGLKPSD